MKAFRISLNGKPFVTAGVGETGVLVTTVNWVATKAPYFAEGEFHLHVGGLDDTTGEHIRWSAPEIKLGDEIRIKFIETEQVTPADFQGSKTELDRHNAERLERAAAEEEDDVEGPDQVESAEGA